MEFNASWLKPINKRKHTVMTVSTMTLGKMTFSKMKLTEMTVSMTTPNKMTFRITVKKLVLNETTDLRNPY
jgi:hypothetical protein